MKFRNGEGNDLFSLTYANDMYNPYDSEKVWLVEPQ